MRKIKKVLSLALSSAILVSGLGVGIGGMDSAKAASKVTRNAQVARIASGDSVGTPEPGDDIATPPAATATVKPTNAPTPTATTPANPSTTAAVTGTAIYKKGDIIVSGNYEYSVTKEVSATEAGEVKVKKIRDAATTKTSLTVPESITKDSNKFLVTGIGQKAFKTSTALKKVTIQKNVTFIGVRAFQGLTTLQQVSMKSGLTLIKERAFAGCTSLRTVTIPSNVKTIGIRSFYNCKKLKAVVIKSKKITKIKTDAFTNTKSGKYAVVPSGKKASYQALLKKAGSSSMKLYTY